MKSNTRFNTTKKGIECLNCKQPISNKDNFCSNCGQVNDLKPLSIKQYLSELLSGFFSFDTRTLTTLYKLIFKPGKVTKEYISGKRMRYVNPFKMYLHVSILFFLIIGIINVLDDYKEGSTTANKYVKIEYTNTAADISKLKDSISIEEVKNLINIKIDSLLLKTKFIEHIKDTSLVKAAKNKKIRKITQRVYGKLQNQITDKYEFRNDSLNKKIIFKKLFISQLETKLQDKNIDYKFPNYIRQSNGDLIINGIFGEKIESKIKIFSKSKTKNPIKALDSLGLKHTKWNIFLYKKVKTFDKIRYDEEYGKEYLRNSVSKISIVLFFILPLFTLFLNLLYFRKRMTYTEHLIFVFNMQTVFFIFFIVTEILDMFFNSDIFGMFLFVIFPIYLFIALKRFYNQGFFKTLIKYFFLNTIFTIFLIIGIFFAFLLAFAV